LLLPGRNLLNATVWGPFGWLPSSDMEASLAPRHPHRPADREPPASLRRLAARFDPGVIDIPGGTARIRLAVRGGGEWDAIVSSDGIWLSAAAERVEPDALLTADEESWDRIARDIRGGMDAFRRRRLAVRRNLL